MVLTRECVGALYGSAQLYGGPAVTIDVLAPELPLITGASSDINNNSVVLRRTFGQIALLLTGDAQAEARLLSHGGADLRADILKVGHHGSAHCQHWSF